MWLFLVVSSLGMDCFPCDFDHYEVLSVEY